MTVKEYLRQGYRLARGIQFKKERILELRELAGQATSTTNAIRVSGTSQRSKLESCICAIDELSREIDEDMGQIRKIRARISQVTNLDYRQLLELHYVNGCTWEQVATKMHYSVRQVYNLHEEALKHCSVLQCSL